MTNNTERPESRELNFSLQFKMRILAQHGKYADMTLIGENACGAGRCNNS